MNSSALHGFSEKFKPIEKFLAVYRRPLSLFNFLNLNFEVKYNYNSDMRYCFSKGGWGGDYSFCLPPPFPYDESLFFDNILINF